jgi:hypothetical protein
MVETQLLPLRVVDGFRLPRPHRDALMPGGVLCDEKGRTRQLPRYFYEVSSWDEALALALAPHFHLWEFIHTDVREAPPLRVFPRYVPCAVTLLALLLERFRDATGTYVRIAANGGYRSPRHQLTCRASTHCWGTAVNIYRIGDTYLETREAIERYAEIAREALPGVWVRPYGEDQGFADDHLHLDLGYVVAVPHDAPGDPFNPKLESDPL